MYFYCEALVHRRKVMRKMFLTLKAKIINAKGRNIVISSIFQILHRDLFYAISVLTILMNRVLKPNVQLIQFMFIDMSKDLS